MIAFDAWRIGHESVDYFAVVPALGIYVPLKRHEALIRPC